MTELEVQTDAQGKKIKVWQIAIDPAVDAQNSEIVNLNNHNVLAVQIENPGSSTPGNSYTVNNSMTSLTPIWGAQGDQYDSLLTLSATDSVKSLTIQDSLSIRNIKLVAALAETVKITFRLLVRELG